MTNFEEYNKALDDFGKAAVKVIESSVEARKKLLGTVISYNKIMDGLSQNPNAKELKDKKIKL